MNFTRLAGITLAAHALLGSPARAQQADSGRVEIMVEESMGMLAGFRVQSSGRSTTTDAAGRARLTLPVGSRVISVTRVGFKPSTVTVVVLQNSLVSVKVTAEMQMAMEMAEAKIMATRIEKLAGETPTRVEVVDEMEVSEKTLMAPSGISMLLNETPGIRVLQAAPGLGTGSVRILGLPGQYTVMLADGLPLYGGSASAMGPLDISPVDLQRVEVIKGAASALYGGQSLGGVIDLISKPPTGRKEILLNRRMLGVTDGATWLSHRLSERAGLSLLAAGTLQSAEDIDEDGWADQAKATRWSVRPRLNLVGADGRSLFVTAGYGFDDRNGGTIFNAPAPDGNVFLEGLRSKRADVGATGSIPRGSGSIAMRAALSSNSRERTLAWGIPREDDRLLTGFVELTRSFSNAKASSLFGAALQLDDYENKLNNAFDRDWFTPGLFFTTEREVGSLTLSASVRGDAHPEAGFQPTARFAVLTKPLDEWSVRASVGTGYAAPTATTEETEAIGLRAIQSRGRLKPEKSLGAMLDINGKLLGAELLMTVYGSKISHAIRMQSDTTPPGPFTLRPYVALPMMVNLAEDSRIGGVEGVAVWRFEGGKFIGSYGYSRGSEIDPDASRRVTMPMLPRHRIGGDLMMEKEGVNRWGIEGIWYGEQALHDNPYRMNSKPYFYLMAIYAHQFGPVEIVANFENLLNVRQTDFDPLVRPSQTHGGRWTTDVWAPLEGFMANVAIRFRWE
jgi:outer membrane receptor for ferrienterochelin and colicins